MKVRRPFRAKGNIKSKTPVNLNAIHFPVSKPVLDALFLPEKELAVAQKLTVEQVKGEILRFWNVFMDKDAQGLMNFYAPDSSVFSSVSARLEPGRLAAARREREYFHGKSSLRSSTSNIDVILLGDNAACASYLFQFHAMRVAGGMGNPVEEDIKQGRATQIFRLEPDGRVLIVHEHLSAVDK